MAFDFLEAVRSLATLLAAGTPGVTYYVLVRFQDKQSKIMQEQCANCKKGLLDQINGLDEDMDQVKGRQKSLREEVLPDKYITKREHDSCRTERRAAEDAIWSRINQLHDGHKGGP